MHNFNSDFERIGLKAGDTVLMHSSMKALQTDVTPQEFLQTLCNYLGEKGTLLLPTLSYAPVHANGNFFSVSKTPACIGLLPNVFMQMEGTIRSMHPTHSCTAKGYLARELTAHHIEDETPVGPCSPFRLLPKVGGKILMLGPVNDHNTFMHGMEEIAQVPYCLSNEKTTYTLIDKNGTELQKQIYAHDFADIAEQRYSRAEALLPPEDIGKGTIGAAESTLLDTASLQAITVPKMQQEPYFFVVRK